MKKFFSHPATKIASFVLVSLVALGAIAFYAIGHGGLWVQDNKPSVTWLTISNAQSELNLSQDSSGNLKAAPSTPVVIIECATDACDSSTLNLSAVIQHYGSKVKILAVNPYKDAQVAEVIDQALIMPSVQKQLVIQLAYQYASAQAQQKNQQVTQAMVQQVLQDPQFQQLAQQQLSQVPLLQQVYPKFFVLSAKTADVIDAQVGLATEADLITFIDGALNPTPSTNAAPSASPATGTDNGTAGSAPATGTTPSQTPAATSTPTTGTTTSGSGK